MKRRLRQPGLGILVLLLCIGVSCQDETISLVEDWTQLSDFPGAPRASASAVVLGEKAYVGMGRSEWLSGYLNDFWCYDIRMDRWDSLPPLPSFARVKAVACAMDSFIYVGLGFGYTPESANGSVLFDFYAFDTVKKIWIRRADYPGSAPNDLSYGVLDGKLFVTGGYTGTSFNKETYCYDPQLNEWNRKADFPNELGSKACFVIGNELYVAGGFRGRNYKTLYCYDGIRDEWSQKCSMPEGRILSTGLSIQNRGYVLLGRNWGGLENGGGLRSDMIAYDPKTDAWTLCGRFPGGKRQNSVAFSKGRTGYVLFGENEHQRFRDVWCFKDEAYED